MIEDPLDGEELRKGGAMVALLLAATAVLFLITFLAGLLVGWLVWHV